MGHKPCEVSTEMQHSYLDILYIFIYSSTSCLGGLAQSILNVAQKYKREENWWRLSGWGNWHGLLPNWEHKHLRLSAHILAQWKSLKTQQDYSNFGSASRNTSFGNPLMYVPKTQLLRHALWFCSHCAGCKRSFRKRKACHVFSQAALSAWSWADDPQVKDATKHFPVHTDLWPLWAKILEREFFIQPPL